LSFEQEDSTSSFDKSALHCKADTQDDTLSDRIWKFESGEGNINFFTFLFNFVAIQSVEPTKD